MAKKSTRKPVKPVQRKHDTILAIVIVFIGLHGLFGAFLGFITRQQQYANQTSWVLPVLILTAVATVVAAVGMWMWKKWGLYLYVITQLIAMVVHLVLTGTLYMVFYDALPLLILGYLLSQHKRLSHFE